jgi:hypothetical protein
MWLSRFRDILASYSSPWSSLALSPEGISLPASHCGFKFEIAVKTSSLASKYFFLAFVVLSSPRQQEKVDNAWAALISGQISSAPREDSW